MKVSQHNFIAKFPYYHTGLRDARKYKIKVFPVIRFVYIWSRATLKTGWPSIYKILIQSTISKGQGFKCYFILTLLLKAGVLHTRIAVRSVIYAYSQYPMAMHRTIKNVTWLHTVDVAICWTIATCSKLYYLSQWYLVFYDNFITKEFQETNRNHEHICLRGSNFEYLRFKHIIMRNNLCEVVLSYLPTLIIDIGNVSSGVGFLPGTKWIWFTSTYNVT